MKTNIYMMLNDIESNAEGYEWEEWTKADAKKLQKKVLYNLRERRKRILIAAAACLSILVVVPFRGTVVDAVGTLTYRMGEFLGIEKDLTPYEQILNKTVSEEGRTITLNSVVLDGNELTVSTTEVYEDSKSAQDGSVTGEIYINGQRASMGAAGGSRQIDDYTTETVMTHFLEDMDYSQKLDVNIKFGGGVLGWGQTEFAFTVQGDQLAADTDAVELTYQFQLPDGSDITLTKYTSNAMGQKVYFENAGNKNNYDMMLKGTDDLGNPVSFYISMSDRQGGRFELDNMDGNLSDEALSLTLTPYAVRMPETSGKMSNDFEQVGEEFTIALK